MCNNFTGCLLSKRHQSSSSTVSTSSFNNSSIGSASSVGCNNWSKAKDNFNSQFLSQRNLSFSSSNKKQFSNINSQSKKDEQVYFGFE